MTRPVLVTRRPSARASSRTQQAIVPGREDEAALAGLGARVEMRTPHGALASLDGGDGAWRALEARGFRVKPLPGADVVRLGEHRIDGEGGGLEGVPPELLIPPALADTWPHHLVLLAAPPCAEWVGRIEAQGVEVAEPVGRCGLFVHAAPGDAARLRALEFVRWTRPFEPAWRVGGELRERTGRVRYLQVTVYPADRAGDVAAAIGRAGGTVALRWGRGSTHRDGFACMVAELDAGRVPAIARLPWVRSVRHRPAVLHAEDDRAAEAIVPLLDGDGMTAAAIVRGYAHVPDAPGPTGHGVVVGICDTGVDTNNTFTLRPGLRGRMAFFCDVSSGRAPEDPSGHGTRVAETAVGKGRSGANPAWAPIEPGVAPGARFGCINAVGMPGTAALTPLATYTRLMVLNGAQVMNNSWGMGPAKGYTGNAAAVDRLVRDPHADGLANPALGSLVMVFSAGDDGSGGVTEPKEAKNAIVVGSAGDSRTGRAAQDGRIVPTVVAPVSPRGGTSLAAAHVSGLVALLIEWWGNRFYGRRPSPAMVKALLVNGADDLASEGLQHVPDGGQGWGRASLAGMVAREPRFLRDQALPFTAPLQEHAFRVRAGDPGRPLRITLAWTDAPGADGAVPALANDLDLEVTEVATGRVFKGNAFRDGFSVANTGDFDHLNNVECVYVEHPSPGAYEVRVIAAALAVDARPPFRWPAWQDYALVIDNAVPA